MPPQKLIQMLSIYLQTCTGIIQKHNGIVGEFIGDGIMAWWNAPYATRDHWLCACHAALEQQTAIRELNQSAFHTNPQDWIVTHGSVSGIFPIVNARMGIHLGSVYIGNGLRNTCILNGLRHKCIGMA